MRFAFVPVEDSRHFAESLRQVELAEVVTESVKLIGREVIPAFSG